MSPNRIRTVFFGTSSFAKTILSSLLQAEIVEVVGVVTQPDRPVGRKKTITPPGVKSFLQKNNSEIPVLQPKNLRKSQIDVLNLKPELIIVADYGQMIPEKIITYPKFKCINVHGSILPKLRGAVPIQRTILDGEKTAGVSIVVMTKDLDNGPILAQKEIVLDGTETSGKLYKKIANIGAKLLGETIGPWVKGDIAPAPQDNKRATYCYQSDIAKENAKVSWNMSVVEMDRKVRGFNPWPVAWTYVRIDGQRKRLKIFDVSIIESDAHRKVGEFFEITGQLAIQLIDGAVILEEIQLEGKKRLDGGEYLWLISKIKNE